MDTVGMSILPSMLLVLFSSVVSHEVRLYQDANFSGFMGEFNATEACVHLESNQRNQVNSIVTDDCIIIFLGHNCNQYSYKLAAGSYSNLSNIGHEDVSFNSEIESFRKCPLDYGGEKTHLTLYNGHRKHGAKILEYKNLCERVTIPTYASKPASFDNHGNCVMLEYSSSNFHWNGSNRTFKGGDGPFSSNCQQFGAVTITAVSPCEPHDSCFLLSATVTGFQADADEKLVAGSEFQVAMRPPTTLINEGLGTVTQEYSAAKTVVESAEVPILKKISKVNNWKVKAGVETEFSAGFPLVARNKMHEFLLKAYSKEKALSAGELFTERYESSTESVAKQRVDILSCTSYSVESFVNMTRGYAAFYNVRFEVSGTVGSRRMSATEIRERIGDLNYVGDKNGDTVLVKERNKITMDFAVRSVVNVNAEVIKKCQKDWHDLHN